MKSLRVRLALWYAASLAALLVILAVATHHHLCHELRDEALERSHPGHGDWVLHADFIQQEIDDILGELFEMWIVIGLPLLCLSTGIGYVLARKSVKPIQRLNDQLGRIGPDSLSTRLIAGEADPYFTQLVARINGLLARVGQGYERLGEYSATVAHELRTPLMLMRLQIEGATGRIDPELAEELQDELAGLSNYIERTLLSARAEQGQLEVHAADTNLSALIKDLAEGHAMLAREDKRELKLELENDVHARTDPALFRQMFDNLVANAIQHGSGTVHVRLARRPSGICLMIANANANTPARQGNRLGLRLVTALATAMPNTTFRRHAGKHWHAAIVRWP